MYNLWENISLNSRFPQSHRGQLEGVPHFSSSNRKAVNCEFYVFPNYPSWIKGEIKPFSDKGKLKDFDTSRCTLKIG